MKKILIISVTNDYDIIVSRGNPNDLRFRREPRYYKATFKRIKRLMQIANVLEVSSSYCDRYGFETDVTFYIHPEYSKKLHRSYNMSIQMGEK